MGGARPFVELADAFKKLAWDVTLLSLSEEVPENGKGKIQERRARLLHKTIATRGSEYDVIDFDHAYLPYSRRDFPPDVLLVARSVLLCQQIAVSRFPQPFGPRRAAGLIVKGPARRASDLKMLRRAQTTLEQADLVNVCNDADVSLLVRSGIHLDKIAVFPFGLSDATAAVFEALDVSREHDNVVAFIGTFDWRKGAADMPKIIQHVTDNMPDVTFRLLGTRGMFRTERDVTRYFPRSLRGRLQVVPVFQPSDLPGQLADCALGFFPSYLEGFPFAVLEMLAAGLPVVAYDAPGPSMMLGSRLLVSIGDWNDMARRIVELLREPETLAGAREAARRRSRDFRWSEIAQRTAMRYVQATRRLRRS